ncbi:MAG: nucleoside-triphosphatase [Campylobacteraceae bacterium]
MKNIFLTGEKGVGKTTLLNKILDDFNFDVGGHFTTREFKNGGVIFYMNDYITKEVKLFADFSNFEQKKVIKETFEVFGVNLLQNALKQKDVIVLDELGPMEENFTDFKKSVYDVLDSPKLTLGILKECDSPFIDSIMKRSDTKVIKVTKENRNTLFDEFKKDVKSFTCKDV